MNRTIGRLIAAVTLLLLAAPAARAQCRIGVTGIAFGTYNVFDDSPVYADGSVTVTCNNKDHAVEVHLSAGTSGTFVPRSLDAGYPEGLSYNIYLTSAYATVWGDGSPGTGVQSATVRKKETKRFTLYGRILAGQDVRAGQYTDTITVLVNY